MLFLILLRSRSDRSANRVFAAVFGYELGAAIAPSESQFIINICSMINQSQEQIRDVLNGQEPTQRNFKQTFQFANRVVTHTHHLEVEFTNKNSEKVEILNHFATTVNQKITKLTEIHFQNRLIKIFDSFTYDLKPMTNNIPNNTQSQTVPSQPSELRRNIMKKRYKTNEQLAEGEEIKVRDMKNVVKNIIRLYQNWVQDQKTGQKQIEQTLCQMIAKEKFNNRLILSISRHECLRKSFVEFIQNSGEECINSTKIKDKESHMEALRRYLRICSDQQYSSQKSQKIKIEEEERQLLIQPQ